MKKLNPNVRLLFLACSVIVSFLLVSTACTQKGSDSVITAISLTKMNVLYVGVDNPAVIAVSGHTNDEIEVSALDDAAKISGEQGQYILNPKRPGVLTLVVKAKGVVVLEAMFRVKAIPDPVVMVNAQKGGKIERDLLAAQEEVQVMIENFDFDLKFSIQSFVISTTDSGGYTILLPTDSNKLTEKQKELIKNLKKGQRINFEDVKAIGPDGSVRGLQPIVFEII